MVDNVAHFGTHTTLLGRLLLRAHQSKENADGQRRPEYHQRLDAPQEVNDL
jgi:hypothetical protein